MRRGTSTLRNSTCKCLRLERVGPQPGVRWIWSSEPKGEVSASSGALRARPEPAVRLQPAGDGPGHSGGETGKFSRWCRGWQEGCFLPGESDGRLGGQLCDFFIYLFIFSLQLFSPWRILSNPCVPGDESGSLCQPTAYAVRVAPGAAALNTSLLRRWEN